MNLFDEIFQKDKEEICSINFISEQHRPIFEEVTNINLADQQLSSIAQFFIAPFIYINPNGVLHIPIGKEFIYEKLIEEVAPHFERIRKVTSGEQVQVMLENVKETSKENFLSVFNTGNINAIALDLYANGSASLETGSHTIKEYKVNLEAVTRTLGHDIVSIWNFFKHSFVQINGQLVLMPNNWNFDESFKDRITVQAFSSVCSSMTILVNTDNNLITSIFIN
ncbi:hypothetical protein NLX71_09470 [Paenibacillus sp. MZ04-78.2]|uniref:hypothetical protein n=1 Tax=Paenibacillus sp. MZ04-78.2 TaxID=2962034 RepID=UPI0020B77467|nr:hypothetical protein [Paenibacillus sp. MZ04-78.2]MCP3773539.1 hypothetical protein [Paenibacillus sp. MZ04-78.2]